MSTVAFTLACPAPFPASEMAAGLTLSGKSTIAKTSVSPKAKYNASNLPPADLKNYSTACRRLVPPSFATPFTPSVVKETCMRYLGIRNPPSRFLRKQKKPAHPGNKSPGQLALNSSFHFPLRRTTCVPSCLASHHTGSLLNDGGGLLRAHKYHIAKGCQTGSTSSQDPK
jgi:hypothetical protein